MYYSIKSITKSFSGVSSLVMAKCGFSGYIKDAGGRKKRLLVAVELLDQLCNDKVLDG